LARTGKDFLSESARVKKLGAASAATHSPHLPLVLKKGSNFFQESRPNHTFLDAEVGSSSLPTPTLL